MPTLLSRGVLEREGFEVIERRQLSLLAGGILVTGEVDASPSFAMYSVGCPCAARNCSAWAKENWRDG